MDTMTERDRALVEEARRMSKYYYHRVRRMADQAESDKARGILMDLWWEYLEAVKETL